MRILGTLIIAATVAAVFMFNPSPRSNYDASASLALAAAETRHIVLDPTTDGTVVDVKILPASWNCPGGCKTGDCRCVDSKNCHAGKCGTDYSAACAAVARGERVTLHVGVVGGQFHVDSLPNIAPGVWMCALEGGKPVMRPVVSQQASPVQASPVISGCPGGQCGVPQQSRGWRR